jgi:hypothetical protein
MENCHSKAKFASAEGAQAHRQHTQRGRAVCPSLYF